MYDLFGNVRKDKEVLNLRKKYLEPPFSVLDTKQSNWRQNVNKWKKLGIKSEIGREDVKLYNVTKYEGAPHIKEAVSIFDPFLCEIMYHWFCPKDGTILDPFSGGSVRGIVANKKGYKYTGIDIRKEQIDSNIEQGIEILGKYNTPNWITGDSNKILCNDITDKFDMIFSCPPYAYLEKYSDIDGDISNMNYEDFLKSYKEIIKKTYNLLKNNRYACFVVGEVRDKKGNYIGFVPDTIKIFKECGFEFYNEIILLNSIGTACLRANGNMKKRKVAKIHQNILVFKKVK